jgi:hypothetical protein
MQGGLQHDPINPSRKHRHASGETGGRGMSKYTDTSTIDTTAIMHVRGVRRLIELSGARPDLEAKTIIRMAVLIQRGTQFTDIIIRKDGKEYRFEADWIGELIRNLEQSA